MYTKFILYKNANNQNNNPWNVLKSRRNLWTVMSLKRWFKVNGVGAPTETSSMRLSSSMMTIHASSLTRTMTGILHLTSTTVDGKSTGITNCRFLYLMIHEDELSRIHIRHMMDWCNLLTWQGLILTGLNRYLRRKNHVRKEVLRILAMMKSHLSHLMSLIKWLWVHGLGVLPENMSPLFSSSMTTTHVSTWISPWTRTPHLTLTTADGELTIFTNCRFLYPKTYMELLYKIPGIVMMYSQLFT